MTPSSEETNEVRRISSSRRLGPAWMCSLAVGLCWLLLAPLGRAEVIIYEGFPTGAGGYSHDTSLADLTTVHPSHLGFTTANTWGAGTSTLHSWNDGLSYSFGSGSPQSGSATTMYTERRGMARDLNGSLVGQTRAEAGIYVSALVRWAHASMLQTYGGFVSAEVNGLDTPNWSQTYGVFWYLPSGHQ